MQNPEIGWCDPPPEMIRTTAEASDLPQRPVASPDSASLCDAWKKTTQALSDLIALGGQKNARIALTTLDAQHQRLRLWAEIIGVVNGQVDNYLNIAKLRDILQAIHGHINSAMTFKGPETLGIWCSPAMLKVFIEGLNRFQRQLQPFLREDQRTQYRRTTRELALELLCADSISELEDIEAACEILMDKENRGSQELLSLVQKRRKLLNIATAVFVEPSADGSQRSRAYLKQARNLTGLWDEMNDRTIGLWKAGGERHVYVEWKSISGEESFDRKDVIYERIQDLADVLSSDMGLSVLPFIGIIQLRLKEIDDHWGFIYELPESTRLDARTQLMPNTLRDLLKLNDTFLPSLSTRVQLALRLASSLLNLHSIGWLHKNVRSENVMFFPENPSQRSLKRPRWVGLTYARGDTDFDARFSERTAW
ncbi:uncharacterized protein KY384_005396 [Bacidia gigantensis]|uniref:uncharacterized protein n=1 Tax=Bacidia gigantensis TaxID=2732470 RepID=UPI001D03F40C|nr:uncharacterized protein KY384_005396 [Bacidia gigantensis]KAG8529915.1 hypothetical protein KY384_005396 [Bacidia gigantensis]